MVKKEEGKELETKQAGALVPRISGDKNLPAGFDEIEEGDIKMSRLAIGQGLSPVVIEGKAKMGDLYQTITNEVFGESVEFIPLFMFKTRARFDTERGLVMMSRDNETVTMAIDEFAEYLGRSVEEVPGSAWDGDKPPSFSVVYNFPLLLTSHLKQFPLALSLMKTAVKPAKEFLSMARYSGEDMFARVYKIKSEIVKGTKGTYALPVIEFSRRCTDEEYAVAKMVFDEIYRRKKDIDVELKEEPSAE
jgi:hypothetical protein